MIELNLSSCTNVDDSIIREVASIAPGLQKLNVEFCEQISDEGFACLANCPRLRILSAEGLCLIGSETVVHVLSHCRNLETVKLAGCDDLSDSIVQAAARYCYRLRFLDVRFCDQITSDALSNLKRRLPSCNLVSK